MKAFFFVILGIFSAVSAQTNCSALDPHELTCKGCTAHPDCGWCGPTATCMNGDRHGPSGNGKCHGPAWFYGTDNCPDCSSFNDCKQCLYHADDCGWCSTTNKCVEWGQTIGCSPVDNCPCDEYVTCSDCLLERGCEWCGSSKTCVSADDPNCEALAHTCPCGDNADCRSCLEDQNQGCVWCTAEHGGSCKNFDESENCMMALDCNTFCKNLGTNCDFCTTLPGCSWCASDNTCVDSQSHSCDFPKHTCPNCANHRYCDTCQDEGCFWCSNGECRPPGTYSDCAVAHTCTGYCGGFSDCSACNQAMGCGWCDDSGECVDADKSSCFLTHSCSEPEKKKFSGGAFVGGMFLGIFLCAAGVGGFLFYKYKIAKKPGYSELH